MMAHIINNKYTLALPLYVALIKHLLEEELLHADETTLCGCLVHAKRKFHDAVVASPNNEIAKIGEDYIRKLFAIENKADKDELSLEERLLTTPNRI